MLEFTGTGAAGGLAMGRALIIKPDVPQAEDEYSDDRLAQVALLNLSSKKSREQVLNIMNKTEGSTAEILRSHLGFLDDPAFVPEAEALVIKTGLSAASAIQKTTRELYGLFLGFEDSYMRERAADILDIGNRLLRNIRGESELVLSKLPPGTVIVAKDLMPSQTALLDRLNLVGFATEDGGKTSHTAIMAKSMGISAVVGCKQLLAYVKNGDTLILDGVSGKVVLSPEKNDVNEYKSGRKNQQRIYREISKTKNARLAYKNGKKIYVSANIGSLAEANTALDLGADGVGLFRSEFLYMERNSPPCENEQFEAYKDVLTVFSNKPVVIRTLDAGGDKQLPYLPMANEANPFMGLRAIRLCLRETELFRTQLRALLRASAYGNLHIMFPMIGSISQLNAALNELEICKNQLREQGVSFNERLPVGMMVEVPAAAMMADEFALRVNFFSIGTNDLTAYALGVDRANPEMEELHNSMHPGVFAMIKNTVDAAEKAGIACGMCGEMASDPEAIPCLAKIGLNEFSVSPAMVAGTKHILLNQANVELAP